MKPSILLVSFVGGIIGSLLEMKFGPIVIPLYAIAVVAIAFYYYFVAKPTPPN